MCVIYIKYVSVNLNYKVHERKAMFFVHYCILLSTVLVYNRVDKH